METRSIVAGAWRISRGEKKKKTELFEFFDLFIWALRTAAENLTPPYAQPVVVNQVGGPLWLPTLLHYYSASTTKARCQTAGPGAQEAQQNNSKSPLCRPHFSIAMTFALRRTTWKTPPCLAVGTWAAVCSVLVQSLLLFTHLSPPLSHMRPEASSWEIFPIFFPSRSLPSVLFVFSQTHRTTSPASSSSFLFLFFFFHQIFSTIPPPKPNQTKTAKMASKLPRIAS